MRKTHPQHVVINNGLIYYGRPLRYTEIERPLGLCRLIRMFFINFSDAAFQTSFISGLFRTVFLRRNFTSQTDIANEKYSTPTVQGGPKSKPQRKILSKY